MRPVVPKIRAGDILLGTKNLRNWLQTASLLGYVQMLSSYCDRYGPKPKKDGLYIPSKKDRFVVCVNAWETFGVWGLDRKAVILFCNPTHSKHGSRVGPAMNPALFAQWFIRTRGRYPDLMRWPNNAYYLWASLHMNAFSNPEDRLRWVFPPETEAPFATLSIEQFPIHGAKERVVAAIRNGLTHPKARRLQIAVGRYGPHLNDIPRMREGIRSVMANPRIMQHLKGKASSDIPKDIILNLIANQ